MATADDWSEAIFDWVIADRSKEERLYLSLDEYAIAGIGREVFGISDGFNDFVSSVRTQLCVPEADGWDRAPNLRLPPLKVLKSRVPACTAFLSLLVVCASRYGDRVEGYEGGNTAVYFFPWFRKLLGGKPLASRANLGELSDTIDVPPEIVRWNFWAHFLEDLGFPRVPETEYGGRTKFIGYALDQAILTESCRRYLRGLDSGGRRKLLHQLRLRDSGRSVDVSIEGATKHLERLIRERWSDPQVQEAVKGTLEGAPPGPRPVAGAIRFVRVRVGVYELRFTVPQRWSNCEIWFGNVRCTKSMILRAEDLKPTLVSFKLGEALQTIKWSPGECIQFLVPGDSLEAWESGTPDMFEEHSLLTKMRNLHSLARLRADGQCDWEEEHDWGGWTDMSGFRLLAPRVTFDGGTLSAKSTGGVVFEGGVRTGERGDRTIRILATHRGGIRPVEVEGKAWIGGRELSLSLDTVAPIPGELEAREFTLEFNGQRTKFELVDWQAIVASTDPPPAGWLGDVR